MKLTKKQTLKAGIFLFCSILLLFMVYKGRASFKTGRSFASPFSDAVVELKDDMVLEQRILNDCERFQKFELRFLNLVSGQTGEIHVVLVNPQNQVISYDSFDLSSQPEGILNYTCTVPEQPAYANAYLLTVQAKNIKGESLPQIQVSESKNRLAGEFFIDGKEQAAQKLWMQLTIDEYHWGRLFLAAVLWIAAVGLMLFPFSIKWYGGSLVPFLSYIMFETITGNLFQIAFPRMCVNLIFYYLLYVFVFLCLNRYRAALIGTTAALAVLASVNYYVLQFRGNPLLPQDIVAWKTAAAVVSNYHVAFSREVFTGCLELGVIGAFTAHIEDVRLSWKRRGIFAGSYAVILTGWLLVFYQTEIKDKLANIVEDIFWWDLKDSYADYGYAVSTAIALRSVFIEKPDGYRVDELWEYVPTAVQEDTGEIIPENIIVIMNESLSEPRVIGDFQTNEDYFPFINNMGDNTIKAGLHVQVFGGGTSNTEYEVLTGNSMSFLPYVISAYQPYCRENEYGVASTLKAQGYTTVAMHPNLPSNWNRERVYGYMGFDEFITDFHGYEKLRDYVSDRGNYERLIARYEEKETGERLFVFNVTMQNHGGYEYGNENFEEEIYALEPSGYPQADRYLSLLKKSDEAFEYLIQYFSEVDEPTMVVLFGDHQAALEDEFYDSLSGDSGGELKAQEVEKHYITPLIIWANYDLEVIETGDISANFLGSFILKLANLELAPYNKFLLSVWEEVPVLGKNGYYMADGSYIPWSSSQEYPEVLKRYQRLQYNNVADRGHRQDSLFVVHEGERYERQKEKENGEKVS